MTPLSPEPFVSLFANDIPIIDYAFRLVFAALCGSIIGLEREGTQKSAGLRTHMLVCVGSALFTLASLMDWSLLMVPTHPLPEGMHLNLNRDPARVAAQIVTGIGFIGGGALLKDGTTVRGVTTAASLWAMAAIGMMVGIGQWPLALFATMLCFIILYTMGRVEGQLFRKHARDHGGLLVEVRCWQSNVLSVSQQLDSLLGAGLLNAEQERSPARDGDPEVMLLRYHVHLEGNRVNWQRLHIQLTQLNGVLSSKLSFLPKQEPDA
jgi:putative Mg2+ transporter-C (MgtC) family protein